MSKAQIMRRAWEIKREHKDNIFGLCLKMAWAEAKEGKVQKSNSYDGLQNEINGIYKKVGLLDKLGGNTWIKLDAEVARQAFEEIKGLADKYNMENQDLVNAIKLALTTIKRSVKK